MYKNGKLTKAEKALYPQFITSIDLSAEGRTEMPNKSGYYYKAMEETDILSAMRRVEDCIRKQGKMIYLVDIYEKTTQETDIGEPVYRPAIMTRVVDFDGEILPSQWYFRDAQHGEMEKGRCVWYATDDCRNGHLQGCD